MKGIFMFCSAGQHEGPQVQLKSTGEPIPAPGWRHLPATFSERSARWIFCKETTLHVFCCPEHHLPGEPALN